MNVGRQVDVLASGINSLSQGLAAHGSPGPVTVQRRCSNPEWAFCDQKPAIVKKCIAILLMKQTPIGSCCCH